MPRVLVVDDQAGVRTIISIVLRIHHFEIVETESAASALKLFCPKRLSSPTSSVCRSRLVRRI